MFSDPPPSRASHATQKPTIADPSQSFSLPPCVCVLASQIACHLCRSQDSCLPHAHLLLQNALFTKTPIYLAVVQCTLTLLSLQWLWSIASCKAVIDNNSNIKNCKNTFQLRMS